MLIENCPVPIIKSAIKALKQSHKKAAINKPVRSKARTMLKKARLNPTSDNLKQVSSALDRAVKRNIFHKNKVSRLKSRLSKLAAKHKSSSSK